MHHFAFSKEFVYSISLQNEDDCKLDRKLALLLAIETFLNLRNSIADQNFQDLKKGAIFQKFYWIDKVSITTKTPAKISQPDVCPIMSRLLTKFIIPAEFADKIASANLCISAGPKPVDAA